jgi:hypothetical protein
MPVLVWEKGESGIDNVIETDRAFTFSPEELRDEAESLDRKLDEVLDSALIKVNTGGRSGAPKEFLRAWAIGDAIRSSGVLDAPEIKNERRERLWKALASKCRVATRSDGSAAVEWSDLRPASAGTPRREGKRLDYFDLCVWLAEQDFEQASLTFGGSIRNVWQMLDRRGLNSLVVRSALYLWLKELDLEVRERLVEPKVYPELMKTLRRRWPGRGPGSAKRPEHYSAQDLRKEVAKVLSALASPEPLRYGR